MPGVCGINLVSPGWLVLGIMAGTGDVPTVKARQYNVITSLSIHKQYASCACSLSQEVWCVSKSSLCGDVVKTYASLVQEFCAVFMQGRAASLVSNAGQML